MTIKIMSTEELRAISMDEFEGKKIKYSNGDDPINQDVSIVIYDYDIGLSLIKDNDHKVCLVNYPGPMRPRSISNTKYEQVLNIIFPMLRKGYYDAKKRQKLMGEVISGLYYPKCSFI